jgi:hypothetical protein
MYRIFLYCNHGVPSFVVLTQNNFLLHTVGLGDVWD